MRIWNGWKVFAAVFLVMVAGDVVQAQTTGTNVQYHTEEEIRVFLMNSGESLAESAVFDVEPSVTGGYVMGKLSLETQENALAVLNQVRYIAGIDADIVLDESVVEQIQAAALVNCANGMLSHYPEWPKGMPQEIYELGSLGAGQSNLGMGYGNFGRAIVNGWMEDSDSSNIDRLGHRRWCLNPEMTKTAFGMAGNYTAMYSFDRGRESGYTGVAWPAQTMPLPFFGDDYAWSFSVGEEVSRSDVQVTLTRVSDQRVWSFSEKSADGYYNVNNDRYGQNGCIIFRPSDIAYADNDVFDVVITGIPNPAHYHVAFFDLEDDTIANISAEGTWTIGEYVDDALTAVNKYGSTVKKGIYQYQGNNYCVRDDEGTVANTGPVQMDGVWYFAMPDGKLVKKKGFVTGLYYDDDELYWVGEDGRLLSNTSKVIGNKKYYFGKYACVIDSFQVKKGKSIIHYNVNAKDTYGSFSSGDIKIPKKIKVKKGSWLNLCNMDLDVWYSVSGNVSEDRKQQKFKIKGDAVFTIRMNVDGKKRTYTVKVKVKK